MTPCCFSPAAFQCVASSSSGNARGYCAPGTGLGRAISGHFRPLSAKRGGQRAGVIVRAADPDDGAASEPARGTGPTFEDRWKKFMQDNKFDPESLIDRRDMPSNWAPKVRFKGFGNKANDNIRRDERRVLDAWSSPEFAIAGGIAVVLTLILFVLIIGPPPSDGRCVLPWC